MELLVMEFELAEAKLSTDDWLYNFAGAAGNEPEYSEQLQSLLSSEQMDKSNSLKQFSS